jgi:hypothetical protein
MGAKRKATLKEVLTAARFHGDSAAARLFTDRGAIYGVCIVSQG